MKERPILFSGAMVRALLAGTKTQTRRAIKLPHMNPLGAWEPMEVGGPNGGRLRDGSTIPAQQSIWHTRTGDSLLCPYGQPGDRLWVREAFAWSKDDPARCEFVAYRATHGFPNGPKWKPSIHMPSWASRITLEITEVRVERLQDISEADAKAEGIKAMGVEADGGWHTEGGRHFHCTDPRQSYYSLWESINGPGSWGANPWVWTVSFKRIKP